MSKELEERKIELRRDINRFKKMKWGYHLENALIEFSEIQDQLDLEKEI